MTGTKEFMHLFSYFSWKQVTYLDERKKMKKLLVILFSFVLASSVFATETIIESCSNYSDFTITNTNGYSRTGDDIYLSNENGALKAIAHVEAAADAWYFGGRIVKNYTTPIDISSTEFFAIDLRIPVANENFTMEIYLTDAVGNTDRLLYYPCGTATGEGFDTYYFCLSDLQKAVWVGHNPIDLKKISRISFSIENGGTIAAGTNFTYYLKNLRYISNFKPVRETVLENFNEYGTVDALTTYWQSKWAGARATVPALVDDGNGGKAAQFTTTFAGSNANAGNQITLATPIDFSGAYYLRAKIKGDTTFSTIAPVMHVFLGDTAGNFADGQLYGFGSVNNNGWMDIYFPFTPTGVNYPTDTTWTTFVNSQWGQVEDWAEFKYWRANATSLQTDLSCINKIVIAEQGTGGTYPVTGSWTIDDLTLGLAMDPMPVATDKNYNVNKVAVAPTVDGTVAAGEWAYAADPACTGFHQYDNTTVAAAEEQSVKAVFDSNYLYLLWQGKNADFKLDYNPVGQPYYNPSGTSYTGDDFEVFLAPAGNNADHFYHMVFFPCTTNNVCYISSEIEGWQAWTLSGSTAAFSYDSVNQNITIEARIPWTEFNSATSPVSGAPADSDEWGAQLAFANNTPSEYTDWAAIDGAGGFNARPFGAWWFKSALAVSNDSVVVTLGQTADLNITAGVAPYTWSFSSSSTVLTSAIGSLSASTGSTVTFTATAVGTAKVYCTSSDAQQKVITLTVVPTAAPLARDWSLME
jgi:hypothetical protein